MGQQGCYPSSNRSHRCNEASRSGTSLKRIKNEKGSSKPRSSGITGFLLPRKEETIRAEVAIKEGKSAQSRKYPLLTMNLNDLTKEEGEDFFANIEFEKSREKFLVKKDIKVKQELPIKEQQRQDRYYLDLNKKVDARIRKLAGYTQEF